MAPATMKTPRFAHQQGHADIAFDSTGRHVITGGCDGDIRVFKYPMAADDDDAPRSLNAGTEPVYTVAMSENMLVVGSLDNTVRVYRYPDLEFTQLLARFTLPVRHVSVGPKGDMIACCGDEHVIKVASTNDPSLAVVLVGHENSVRSVAYDPRGDYVASSSCDGTVKIWKVSLSAAVKTLNILPRTNSNASPNLCRLSFHPNGNLLAVPVGRDIHLYNREAWALSATMRDDAITQDVSITCFDRTGSFLAAAASDGSIVVWDVMGRAVVSRFKHPQGLRITGLAWAPPSSNAIAWIDARGEVCDWEDVVPLSHLRLRADAAPVHAPSVAGAAQAALPIVNSYKINKTAGDGAAPASARPKRKKVLDSDEDDDDLASATPKRLAGASKAVSLAASRRDAPALMDHSADDALMDDTADDYADADADADLYGYVGASSARSPFPQPALQPGSTPRDQRRHFMAYNATGLITCRDEHTHQQIEIEFHDRMAFRPVSFVDHYRFEIAALGEKGAVFACPESDKSPSTVFFKATDNWAPNSDWTIQLPGGESAVCVAVGEAFVAVATTAGMLRLITCGGVQAAILSLEGTVVAMSGHMGQLLVAANSPDGASLRYTLLDVPAKRRIADGAMPLSPKSRLKWIGFSQEGVPMSYDAKYVLRGLTRDWDFAWTVLCDTMQYKIAQAQQLSAASASADADAPPAAVPVSKDNYWVVGATGSQVMCVTLRLGDMHPPAHTKPVMTVIPMGVPVCLPGTDAGRREEAYLRSVFHYNHSRARMSVDAAARAEAQIDSALLELVQRACKADRNVRALDLCQLLHLQKSYEIAIKVAQMAKQNALAQKIDALRKAKLERDNAESARVHSASHDVPVAALAPPAPPPRNASAATFQTPAVARQQDSAMTANAVHASGAIESPESPSECVRRDRDASDANGNDVDDRLARKPAFDRRRTGGDDAYAVADDAHMRKATKPGIAESLAGTQASQASSIGLAKVPPTPTTPACPPKINPFAKSAARQQPVKVERSLSFFENVQAIAADGAARKGTHK